MQGTHKEKQASLQNQRPLSRCDAYHPAPLLPRPSVNTPGKMEKSHTFQKYCRFARIALPRILRSQSLPPCYLSGAETFLLNPNANLPLCVPCLLSFDIVSSSPFHNEMANLALTYLQMTAQPWQSRFPHPAPCQPQAWYRDTPGHPH